MKMVNTAFRFSVSNFPRMLSFVLILEILLLLLLPQSNSTENLNILQQTRMLLYYILSVMCGRQKN